MEQIGQRFEGACPNCLAIHEPGDCLYLPRGWVHSAGVVLFTGHDVAKSVIEALASQAELRASLPFGLASLDAARTEEHTREVLKVLARLISEKQNEVTYGIYQRLITAYEASGKRERDCDVQLLRSIRSGVPKELPEIAQLGRPLWKCHRETFVGASKGPVEAINGRLKNLRGIALGFRNLNHYILRSSIHSGQPQDRIKAL